MDNAQVIAHFREKAMALGPDDARYIQKRLHEPTVKLRKGGAVDEAAFLKELSNDLSVRRRQSRLHRREKRGLTFIVMLRLP
jgi:hypothetical protein